MKWIFVAVGVLCSACLAADSSSLATEQDAWDLSDSAMKLVAADKTNEAFDFLKPFWPLPANEIDTLQHKTLQSRNQVAPRFGAIVGYSFVREDKVSDFAVRYIFVEKREYHVLRWVFTFYRPKSRWYINSVIWDDNLGALFEK